jgi:hypothetical protein
MDLIRERLANQFLTGESVASPVEVVRRLGAVQSQDYPNAKWALGIRTQSATDADVEAAISRGEILRTHIMRPTWHFVLPEDIRWMMALTGPRIAAAMASYNKRLGLTPAVLKRTNRAIEKMLRDGQCLTRREMLPLFTKARIGPLTTQSLAHVVMQAEVDAVICSGPCRGKQFTYALFDARVPPHDAIDRDEALSRLAERYYATRGPATTHDFAWWSGLTVSDARRAVDIRGKALTSVNVDGNTMWMVERSSPARPAGPSAHLLPNYDEYFIGYRDRSAIGRRLKGSKLVEGGDGSITHVTLVNGELVGGWKRVSSDRVIKPVLTMLTRLSATERGLVERAASRFEAFVRS